MRLGWVQALFVAGALVTYLGFAWRGAEKLWPMFVPAVAAFILSIGRGPLPLFLLLFAAATVAVGFAVFRGMASTRSLVLMAASDLVLAFALTLFQRETTQWSLPAPGGWESGSFLIAGAAALRLASPITEDGDEGLSLLSLGSWQGIFLAVWAGRSARLPLLVASALLLIVVMRRRNRSSAGSLGMIICGAAASIGAGLGLHPLAAFSAGAAGAAFALGERAVAMIVLAGLPLSAFWQQTPDGVGAWAAGLSLLIPIAIAVAVATLTRPGTFGGRVTAALAASTALWLGLTIQTARLWIVYGLAATFAVTMFVTRPVDVATEAIAATRLEPPAEGRFRAAATVVAYGAAVITVVLVIRMIAIGFGTGFL
jgi:hypothetical protein